MNEFLEYDENKKTIKALNLDDFSIEDLNKYITELKEEINRAMKLDYPIIGINNRNLKNLKTDVKNSANLFTNITNDFTVIAESGIKSLSDIEMYNELGIFNFLIGESILRSDDYTTYIKNLLNNG